MSALANSLLQQRGVLSSQIKTNRGLLLDIEIGEGKYSSEPIERLTQEIAIKEMQRDNINQFLYGR